MNTMRAWRELQHGMQGQPDVKAAQRGLWRLLGTASTNARNGNYGDQTSSDVAKARAELGIEGDADTIGGTLYEALEASFDASAWQLACEQPAAVTSPTPTCKRLPLTKGMEGDDIAGAQRALWRALQGGSTNARNGVFGDYTELDIGAFRERYAVNLGDSNAKIGADLWAVLTRWMDQHAVDLVHQQQPPPGPAPASSWDAVGDQAWWGYSNRDGFTYAQVRPMPELHSPPQVRTDCSGYYTACCQAAGVPNPNRSDGVYDGYGWTGTLAEHGAWTSSPQRGDAALYGQAPSYGPVAVYLGDGTCISFGGDPITHVDAYYRSDFAGFR